MVLSFVDTQKPMTAPVDIADLESRIADCRQSGAPLENLDLSSLDLANIDFGHLNINNVIFNAFDKNKAERKVLFGLNFKGSILNNVSFAHCRLIRCNFDRDKKTLRELQKESDAVQAAMEKDKLNESPTIISTTDFFFSELEYCRFRGTEMNIVDFRYAKFADCTLGGSKVVNGDFYMAAFCGTTAFEGCKFSRCSISNATFEHDCIRIRSINKLAQECYKDFNEIIIGYSSWRHQNPCGDFSHVNEGEDRGDWILSRMKSRKSASKVYAQLSGAYAGKGLNKDSNKAYELAKRNEVKMYFFSFLNEARQIFSRKFLRHLWKSLSCLGHIALFHLYWIFGFGYKFWGVVALYLGMVCAYVAIYYCRATEQLLSLKDLFAYSLNNSLSPYDKFTVVIGDVLTSCLETTAGVLLLGFLGFIIANRIRNNY